MTKIYRSDRIVSILTLVTVFLQVISPMPTGHKTDKSVKLKQLFEALDKSTIQDYIAKHRAGHTESPSNENNKAEDTQTEKIKSDDLKPTTPPIRVADDIKTNTKTSKVTSRKNQRSRSLTSEDMKSQTAERDRDETDLQRLSRALAEQNHKENSLQILAKALIDELGYDNIDEDANDDGNEPSTKIKPTETPNTKPKDNKKNKDMTTSEEKLLNDFLQDALDKLDEQDGDNNDLQSYKKKSSRPPSQKMDENGDDSDDEGDKLEEELLKSMIKGGYFDGNPSGKEQARKLEAINIVENRLMDDLERAGQMGVSVDDLIKDLEDRAYKEAVFRSLTKLLRSQR